MKKLLFLFSIFLTGCGCLLSQVPPQTIYVDENCQGVIPDYRSIVIATDNCEGLTLAQTPAAGTILDAVNPSANVEIIGTDAFGNKSNKLIIPVILIDTIAPVLSWPETQIAMSTDELINIYKVWEAGIKVKGIADWIYDQSWTQGMAFADTTFIMENLKTFTHAITLTDEEYDIYRLLMDSN